MAVISYTGGECYRPLVELQLAGGDFLSDRSLLADEATMRLRGTHALPSHTTLFRFLAGADLGRAQKAAAVNRAMLRRAWAMGAAPTPGIFGLVAELRAAVPVIPSRALIDEIRIEIERVTNQSSPDVIRQLFGELIDRIEISPDHHAYPYFRIPDAKKPGPSGARASCRTPVRMGSHHVELRCRYSNSVELRDQLDQLLSALDRA